MLTLTDGVRQSGQGIGYGGGNLSIMDPFQIERVEILRGPNSVLYGTDALGGVIQAITRKPRERTEFDANGGVRYEMDTALDSHNFGAYADFGDRNVGMILGGSWASFDRPDVPAEQPASGGDFDRMAGYGRIDWRVAPNSVLSFYANVVHNSDVTISQSQLGLPVFVGGFLLLSRSTRRWTFPSHNFAARLQVLSGKSGKPVRCLILSRRASVSSKPPANSGAWLRLKCLWGLFPSFSNRLIRCWWRRMMKLIPTNGKWWDAGFWVATP